MEKNRETEKIRCVFNITEGYNQILPNATTAIQNFYGTGPYGKEEVCTYTCDACGEVLSSERASVPGRAFAPPAEQPTAEELQFEGQLSIYYPDADRRAHLIAQIAACRDAGQLAQLVVKKMLSETFLDESTIVKEYFIRTLAHYTTFIKGHSVENIGSQIRSALHEQH